jgi:hypothetical protein
MLNKMIPEASDRMLFLSAAAASRAFRKRNAQPESIQV